MSCPSPCATHPATHVLPKTADVLFEILDSFLGLLVPLVPLGLDRHHLAVTTSRRTKVEGSEGTNDEFSRDCNNFCVSQAIA